MRCGCGEISRIAAVDCLGLYARDAYTNVQDVDARYGRVLNASAIAVQDPVQEESRIVG
jgi:hypothetical protein